MASEGITPFYVYAVIIHAVLLALPEVTSSNVTFSLLSTLQSSLGVPSKAPNQSSFKTEGTPSNSSSVLSLTPSLTTSMTSSMTSSVTSSGLTVTVPLTSRGSTFSLMMSSTITSSVAHVTPQMTSSVTTLKSSHLPVSTTPIKTPTKNTSKKEETHSHVESTEGKVVIWILLAICAACFVVLAAHLFLVIVSDKKKIQGRLKASEPRC